ncbi:uncharacterized protein LOC114303979 [Camellia sinensis]|uniref:uncharacterized protein LOC114303979 n=1 Tax=Camellia sinensis TaxID=4442 RepID=UPI001035EB4C|nr:uncharacterized protein LOC114303979 [Camellia sinensis]
MIAVKYEAKFTELARFAPHMVDTDYKNVRKFEGSLRNDILERVNVLKFPTYVDVLDWALMSKTNMANQNKPFERKGKRQGFFLKKKMFKKQIRVHRVLALQGTLHQHVTSVVENTREFVTTHLGCVFDVAKLGIWLGGRPSVSSTGSIHEPRNTVRPNATKDTLRQERVFVLVPGDLQNTKAVVSSTISIRNQDAFVLMDLRSTHSFVSTTFAFRLNRPLESLPYLLYVSAPSGESLLCTFVYRVCDMHIGNVTLCIDLLPLDIRHFDVIMEMDWLSKYYATIDCVTKWIMFRSPGHDEFEFVAMNVEMDSIPIFREFLDLFPDELLGELVGREIEFTIDIALRTQPIPKTPYRMSTVAMKELKE